MARTPSTGFKQPGSLAGSAHQIVEHYYRATDHFPVGSNRIGISGEGIM
jgi:hypothetical protein